MFNQPIAILLCVLIALYVAWMIHDQRRLRALLRSAPTFQALADAFERSMKRVTSEAVPVPPSSMVYGTLRPEGVFVSNELSCHVWQGIDEEDVCRHRMLVRYGASGQRWMFVFVDHQLESATYEQLNVVGAKVTYLADQWSGAELKHLERFHALIVNGLMTLPEYATSKGTGGSQ